MIITIELKNDEFTDLLKRGLLGQFSQSLPQMNEIHCALEEVKREILKLNRTWNKQEDAAESIANAMRAIDDLELKMFKTCVPAKQRGAVRIC